MSIITLTSDWGTYDYYVGAVKGYISNHSPDTTIVDINHQVARFNISQAAFVLRNSFGYFPSGTIHLIAVNTEPVRENAHVVVLHEGHYFVGADNGIFGLLMKENPAKVIKLHAIDNEMSSFPSLALLAPAACKIANGEDLDSLGNDYKSLRINVPMRPVIDESVISGKVLYVDSFKNAITNISRELFDRVGKGRDFEIFVQSNHYRVNQLNRTYSETSAGELLALFNTSGLLEIAINRGAAAQLLNLDTNSTIRVKFNDKKMR
jgi:hypothetical protein